jgi:hypothetical protein
MSTVNAMKMDPQCDVSQHHTPRWGRLVLASGQQKSVPTLTACKSLKRLNSWYISLVEVTWTPEELRIADIAGILMGLAARQLNV